MPYEINIGLNVNGAANTHHEVQQRAYKAVALIRKLCGSNALVSTCRVDSQYEDNNGTLVLEPTLWAKVHGTSENFYKLAEALEQDCIAVYNPRAGKGDLIGPNASKWGEFNIDYFNRPSETTQLDVAA